MLIFDILCLIGVKGTKTPPKMLKHFSRAWADSRMLFSVLREQRDRRDPADTKCRGGSALSRGKRSACNGNQQPNLTEPTEKNTFFQSRGSMPNFLEFVIKFQLI